MMKLLYIGLGGFFGSVGRYLASGLAQKLFPSLINFPVGTLVVNVSGCLMIGFLSGLAEQRQLFSPELRMMVFIGFLGGFTTFSTFGFESFSLARDQQYFSTFLNVLLHIILGLPAVWLGHIITRYTFGD